MQAGDKLDFIAPFDVTEPTRVLSDEERSGQMLVFGDIMQRLVFGRPELVTSLEVLD